MATYTQYWDINGSGPNPLRPGEIITKGDDNKFYLSVGNSSASTKEVFVTDPNAVSSAVARPASPNASSSVAAPTKKSVALIITFVLPDKTQRIAINKTQTLNAVIAGRKDIFGEFGYIFTLGGRVLDNTESFDSNGIVTEMTIVGTYTLDSIIVQHLSRDSLPSSIKTLVYFDAEFQSFNMADSFPFAHTPPSNGSVNATHFILNMGHICLELERNQVSQSMSIAPLFVDKEKEQFRDPTILLAKYIIANDGAWPEIDAALKIPVDPDLPAELRASPTIELHKLFRRTGPINRCISLTGCTKEQRGTAIRTILAVEETDNTYPFLSELLQLYPDKKDEINDALRITHDLYMKHSFDAVNTALIGDDSDPRDYFDRELYELHKQMQNPHTLFVCKGKTDLYAIYNTFQRYEFPVMNGELKCAFFNLDMPRSNTPKVFPIMKLSNVSDLYKLRYGLTDFYDHMQYMYVTQYLARIGSTRIVEHNPLVDSLMHMIAHIGFSFDVNGTEADGVVHRTNFSIFDIVQQLFGIPYYQPYDNSHILSNTDLKAISYPSKTVNGIIKHQDEAFANKMNLTSFERGCLTATSYFMPSLKIHIEDIYVDPVSGHEFTVYQVNDGTFRIKNIKNGDNLTGIIYFYAGGPPPTYRLLHSQTTGIGQVIPNEIYLRGTRYTVNGSPIDVTYIGQQIIGTNANGTPAYRNIYRYNNYLYTESRDTQNTLDIIPLKYGVEITPPPPPPGPSGHPRRRKTRRQRRALKSRRRKSRKA